VRAVLGAPGQPVRELPSEVESFVADVVDRDTMLTIVDRADVVVHLAGPASVRQSLADPVEYVRVHVGGTVSVLDACRRANVARFVYLSSAEVYGRPITIPVDEDQQVQPRSPYGAAKAAAELAVRSYCASFGTLAAILRPFSVYGPGVAPDSLVGTIARQVRAGGPIRVADLRPVRDYCYVADLADAVARACTAEIAQCAIINVASGVGTSVAELARAASRVAGRDQAVEENAAGRRPESAETFSLVADVRRARDILGWSATTSIDEGLAATI
jgi:nucleoside-diphosphate-sugar epimerase